MKRPPAIKRTLDKVKGEVSLYVAVNGHLVCKRLTFTCSLMEPKAKNCLGILLINSPLFKDISQQLCVACHLARFINLCTVKHI